MAIKKRGQARPLIGNYHQLNYKGYANRCYQSGKFGRVKKSAEVMRTSLAAAEATAASRHQTIG